MIIKRKCTLVTLTSGLLCAHVHCGSFTYEIYKNGDIRLPVLYIFDKNGNYIASAYDVVPDNVLLANGFYTFKGRNFSGLA